MIRHTEYITLDSCPLVRLNGIKFEYDLTDLRLNAIIAILRKSTRLTVGDQFTRTRRLFSIPEFRFAS